MHRRDGYHFYGSRIRVELAKGRRDEPRGDRDRSDRGGDRGGGRDRGDDRNGGDRNGDRGRDRPERARREFRRQNTGFTVLIKGLPPAASWQDVKDFIRQVVRPVYTDILKDRSDADSAVGVAGFENAADMDRCIRKLDNTEFKNASSSGECIVRITEDTSLDKEEFGGAADGRDRSRSPVARRGRSRSPRRRATSSSPPTAAAKGRSRSASPRSRSRSPVAAAARDGEGGRRDSRSRSLSPPVHLEKERSPAPGSRSPSP